MLPKVYPTPLCVCGVKFYPQTQTSSLILRLTATNSLFPILSLSPTLSPITPTQFSERNKQIYPHTQCETHARAFTQEDVSGRPIIVRFKNDEDVQAYAKLIGQTITEKTKFIWYPYQGPESYTHL